MLMTFPFEIPERLHSKLPAPSQDGNIYADVFAEGCWDGIVVFDSHFRCIGIYQGRQVRKEPIFFLTDKLEDFRTPSKWNWILASLPFCLNDYDLSLIGIWLICPILLLAGWIINPYFYLTPIPIVVLSIRSMYQIRGFPFLRLLTAIAGVGFLMDGLILFIQAMK